MNPAADLTAEQEAILRVCTRDAHPLGPRYVPAPKSILNPPHGSDTTQGLGNLKCLPLEIIHEILGLLDIQSCWAARQVSVDMRTIVTNTPPYKVVARHATDAFRALLQTGFARHVRASQLKAALCTDKCSTCFQYAQKLHLPSMNRLCQDCSSPILNYEFEVFHTSPDHTPRAVHVSNLNDFLQRLEISLPRDQQLAMFEILRVPKAWKLPGQDDPRTKRMEFIAVWRSFEALRQHGVTITDEMIDTVICPVWSGSAALDYCGVYLPYMDPATLMTQSGLYCQGCSLASCMADWENRQADVYWDGPMPSLYVAEDRRFTRESYGAHFGGCLYAQRLWAESCQGRVQVDRRLRSGTLYNPIIPMFDRAGNVV